MPRPTRDPAGPLQAFAYGAVTLYGQPFQTVLLAIHVPMWRSHDPGGQARRFRLFPVRSPLLRESRLVSFPPGTKMFQFPGFASARLWIQHADDRGLPRPGCPIRRSPDQRLLAGSPRLIAGSHVLHRRSAPRHPPWALGRLTDATSNHRQRPWPLWPLLGPCWIHRNQLVKNDPANWWRIAGSNR